MRASAHTTCAAWRPTRRDDPTYAHHAIARQRWRVLQLGILGSGGGVGMAVDDRAGQCVTIGRGSRTIPIIDKVNQPRAISVLLSRFRRTRVCRYFHYGMLSYYGVNTRCFADRGTNGEQTLLNMDTPDTGPIPQSIVAV